MSYPETYVRSSDKDKGLTSGFGYVQNPTANLTNPGYFAARFFKMQRQINIDTKNPRNKLITQNLPNSENNSEHLSMF